jgi:hypothetical protein
LWLFPAIPVTSITRICPVCQSNVRKETTTMFIARKYESNIALSVGFFFAAAALFCLVFLSVVTIPFVHHDEYNYFAPGPRWGLFTFPPSVTGLALGRPLQVIVASLFMLFIDTPADLGPLRALSIIFLAFDATVW